MKTFNLLAVLSLVIAIAGIMYENGQTSIISVLSCLPLLGFVVTLIVSGIRGWLGNKN